MLDAVSVTVREAGEVDLAAILALYAQPDFNGAAMGLDEARAHFARFRLYPDYRLYVAETGGEVTGTFALLVMDNLSRKGRLSAIIEAVVVASGRQGEGIGRAMLRAALDIARQKGCYKAALSSGFGSGRSHAFYDSLGFARHGVSFCLDLPEAKP